MSIKIHQSEHIQNIQLQKNYLLDLLLFHFGVEYLISILFQYILALFFHHSDLIQSQNVHPLVGIEVLGSENKEWKSRLLHREFDNIGKLYSTFN